jgi:pectate lyase
MPIATGKHHSNPAIEPMLTFRILFPVLFISPVVCSGIPAFPGAEGYGALAKGGRGGDVYIVKNLESSGDGSLYHGVTTIPKSGRTIVFAVSGEIHLAGGIKTRITGNNLTIAGQTAPGDGVLLRDGTLRISGDDIVIRHLRFRHGKKGSGGDCIDLDSNCSNAILDHVSMAFSTDENISSFKRPPENLTMQWSLNAWGLESHSCGGLWDQNHATCHHSLWAHNHTRNPKARPGGLLEWTNNVTFDWDIGFIMGDSATPAGWKANVIGNYFICPAGNIRNTPLEKARLDRDGKPNFSVYLSDNLHDMDGDEKLDGTDRGWEIVQGEPFRDGSPPSGNYHRMPSAFPGSGLLAIDDPRTAYKKIVSDAGPQRYDHSYAGSLRDEVDARLIENLVSIRRNHISRESDLKGIGNDGFGTFKESAGLPDQDEDGMPDVYERAMGWNPQAQDHNSPVRNSRFFPNQTAEGYTALEEYLHFKSVPHVMLAKGSLPARHIDLGRYVSGFVKSPRFVISGVGGGEILQAGDGGRMVRFAAGKTIGGGGFFFTVTDADGASWTRQFAVCITDS